MTRSAPARPSSRSPGRPGAGPSRRPPSTVSATSAQRFAAKVRSRRRRRTGWGLVAVTLAAALAWLALLSPWLTVSRVEVAGTVRLSPAQVRAAAETEMGRPLLLARTDVVAARVGDEHLVRAVEVSRHWPATLRIRVEERVAVAALPAGRGVLLVDIDGQRVARAASVPRGMPELDVDLDAAGAASVTACLSVLRSLPNGLRSQVRRIGAASPDAVRLRLDDGAIVEWGSAAESPFKAQVLEVLRTRPGSVYDVRSPRAPTVR